ncbi:hypothetical protein EHS25_010012 [Saitozyma podzolica]|uniref:Uncharacterized protein n=1 Tax=Saitozyma podzolica TaxID=1890683 RepID=A0A427YID5_9TREE|nr:hypothetical protein EHS25_010012 [Saitozyma podzolica]
MKWFFLGLGLVLGMILVVCIYINWRGPNQRLIPCLGVRDEDEVEGTEVEAPRNGGGGGGDEKAHAEGSFVEEKARSGAVTSQKGFIAGSAVSVVAAQEVRTDRRTSRKLHKARASSVASSPSRARDPGQTASGRRNTLGGSPGSTLPPYSTHLYSLHGRLSMPDNSNHSRRIAVRWTASSFGHSPSVGHASFGPMTPTWQLPPMPTQPPLVYSPTVASPIGTRYGSGTPSLSGTSHWVEHETYPFHLPRFDAHPRQTLPPGNEPQAR